MDTPQIVRVRPRMEVTPERITQIVSAAKRLREMAAAASNSGVSEARHGSTASGIMPEASGPWSHSASRINLGRIPRGIYGEVKYEPRYSYLETGNMSLGSALNETGLKTAEYWSGDNVNFFMGKLMDWVQPNPITNTTTGTRFTPISMAKEKVKGYIFQETLEYILTNQSNVPVRLWILDYVWKRTARHFPMWSSTSTQAEVNTTFENLWREGYYLDTNTGQSQPPAAPLIPERNYGYTYGRSDPLQSYIRIAKRKELHLQPGQTHIHSVIWNINKELDMQKITSLQNWDTNDRKFAGLTHGTAFIQHGTVGASTAPGAWCLLPTEIGVVWRRSLNMTMRAREMGFTQTAFGLDRAATTLPKPLINNMTGEERDIEKTAT